MALEHPAYRDNLERVCNAFPDKEMLTVSEVSRFTGLDRKTVRKRFSMRQWYISVACLARQMCS